MTMSHSSQSNGAPESSSADIDFVVLFRLLWRRKFLVLLVMLLGFGVSVFLASKITDRYASYALLLINPEGPQSVQDLIENVGNTQLQPDESVVVETMEILRSRLMARMIVKEMNLLADAEFAGRHARPNIVVPENNEAVAFKSLSLGGEIFQPLSAEDSALLDRAITRFLELLTVREASGASAIHVEFVSRDPQKSADIVNKLAALFIQQRVDEKIAAAKRVNRWIDQNLLKIRTEIETADEALQLYKKQNNLLADDAGLNEASRGAALKAQVTAAQAELIETRARLEHTKNLDFDALRLESLPDVFDSSAIATLQADRADLTRALADISGRYGAKHPRMIQVRQEMDSIEEKLRDEASVIVDLFADDLRLAEARVVALEDEVTAISEENFVNHKSFVQLRSLEHELQAKKLSYEQLVNSYRLGEHTAALQEPSARVISSAVSSRESVAPHRGLVIGLGVFLSFCLGAAIAFILEKADGSFRSSMEMETVLGVPCFALIPSAPMSRSPDVARYVIKKPGAMVAEAVRTLRMVLRLRTLGDGGAAMQPKVMTVTSSFPKEGKTVLASWLGRVSAQAGERVIVIDCDLRRPNLHAALGAKNEVSLVEHLTGNATLDDVIQRDPESGMDVIYTRSVPHSALQLLGGDMMRKMVNELRGRYDLVLLDAPPCLAVSDARVLSTYSDLTLYGVAWAKTPQVSVVQGLKQFTDINIQAATVLLNVNVKRHVKYGYGDVFHYTSEA